MSKLLVWNGTGLIGRGLQAQVDRDLLVPGTYIPGPDTTGPTFAGPFTQVFPGTPDDPINITAPGVYQNREYWGRVRIQSDGVEFRNCIFRGPRPSQIAGFRGCIQNYGTNPPHFKMYDCLIDPSAWAEWHTSRAIDEKSAIIVGVHGGNFEMYRTEIVWCQDAINYIGPNGAATTIEIARAAYCIIEGSWFHRGFYINDWYGPADGQPHADGFQINTGKNITLRGNMIGGTREPAGYADTGRGVAGALGWGNGFNLGDDFWNAAIFLQQEVSNGEIQKIENILIEKNFLAGGTMTVNWAYAAGFTNHWESLIFRDNKFFTRGLQWGNFSPTNGTGGNGWYANLSSNDWNGNLWGQRYNNTNYETGALIPSANA